MYDQAVDKLAGIDVKKSWSKFASSTSKGTSAVKTRGHKSAQVNSMQERWEAHTILFGFDRSTLNKDDLAMLKTLSGYLKAHRKSKIKIFGHTDERGSSEYNIALGWRRALSVSSKLESMGVAPKQMEVVSYGKEKPKVLGHNEMAWYENRRVEFKYLG